MSDISDAPKTAFAGQRGAMERAYDGATQIRHYLEEILASLQLGGPSSATTRGKTIHPSPASTNERSALISDARLPYCPSVAVRPSVHAEYRP